MFHPQREPQVRDEAYRQWRYKERMGVEAAPLGEYYNHAKDDEGNIYRVYPNIDVL